MLSHSLRVSNFIYRFSMSSSQRLAVIESHISTGQGHSGSKQYCTSNTQNTAESLLMKLTSPEIDEEPVVYQLINSYNTSDESGKRLVLKTLAEQYSCDPASVMHEMSHLQSIAQSSERQPAYQRQAQKVRASLVSPYEKIFRTISSFPGGVKFLVDIRKDAIKLFREAKDGSNTDLHSISSNLKEVSNCLLPVIENLQLTSI